MKVLVIGAGGQIGRLLPDGFRGHTVRGTRRPDVDLRERASVTQAIRSFDPEAVVLAAGLANADHCEDHPGDAYAINVDATRAAAEESRGRHFTFFSTDHVFDGKEGPYGEDALPAPINVYGRTKMEAERIVSTIHPEALIIRTSLVFHYDQEGRSFFMNLLRAPGPVPCWTDHWGTYTYGPNLADAAAELVVNRRTGIWHVAGRDLLNRHEFALRVAARFGLDGSLFRPVSIRDAAPRAPRALRAGLRVDRARAALRTRLLSVDEALEDASRRARG